MPDNSRSIFALYRLIIRGIVDRRKEQLDYETAREGEYPHRLGLLKRCPRVLIRNYRRGTLGLYIEREKIARRQDEVSLSVGEKERARAKRVKGQM